MTRQDIEAYYRRQDPYVRYTMENRKRVSQIRRLFGERRKYFGKALLDLACGGGILGFLVEAEGLRYLGVDVSNDMVRSARRSARAKGSGCVFIRGDVRTAELRGTFQTVALLGNAVIHFTPSDLRLALTNIEGNVERGAHFLVEYRDVVGMLFAGEWSRRYVEDKGKGRVVNLSKDIDTERGEVKVESKVGGKHSLNFGAAVWSPYIMEAVMTGSGWRLVERERTSPRVWLDVYVRT